MPKPVLCPAADMAETDLSTPKPGFINDANLHSVRSTIINYTPNKAYNAELSITKPMRHIMRIPCLYEQH